MECGTLGSLLARILELREPHVALIMQGRNLVASFTRRIWGRSCEANTTRVPNLDWFGAARVAIGGAPGAYSGSTHL